MLMMGITLGVGPSFLIMQPCLYNANTSVTNSTVVSKYK